MRSRRSTSSRRSYRRRNSRRTSSRRSYRRRKLRGGMDRNPMYNVHRGITQCAQGCRDVNVQSHEDGWIGVGVHRQTGLVIDKDGAVTEIYEGSPAENAGVRKGEKIVAVDGIIVEGDNGAKDALTVAVRAGFSRSDPSNPPSVTLLLLPP